MNKDLANKKYTVCKPILASTALASVLQKLFKQNGEILFEG